MLSTVETSDANRVLRISGGWDRTTDTRLMKPLSEECKPNPVKTYGDGKSELAQPLAQAIPKKQSLDPELALLIDHWDSLPEAIRAGILAMVRAAGITR